MMGSDLVEYDYFTNLLFYFLSAVAGFILFRFILVAAIHLILVRRSLKEESSNSDEYFISNK